jgi:hypothetical protein
MKTDNNTKLSTLLFNPFARVAGAKALVIGGAAILLAGFLGVLSKTHFDGVLDTHTGGNAPVWFFLSEGFIDWICLTATLLIVGRIASRTSFRTIDLVGTQAMARWPTVLVSLIVLPKGYQRFTNSLIEQFVKHGEKVEFVGVDAFIFLAVALGMVLLLCWMAFLMYKSYSISCNLSGTRALFTFAGGVIVAEALSKTALFFLLKQA